jgi:hypothetical protein
VAVVGVGLEPETPPLQARHKDGAATADPVAALLWAAAVFALWLSVFGPVLLACVVGLLVAVVAVVRSVATPKRPSRGVLVAAAVAGIMSLPVAVVGTTTGAAAAAWMGVADSGGTDGSLPDARQDAPQGQDVLPPADVSPVDPALADAQAPPDRPPERVTLLPDEVMASGSAPPSRDSAGAEVRFDAVNATDDDQATAWRVAGDGVGEFVVLTWAEPVTVSEIALIPGYAKVDVDGTDRFFQNRRVASAQFVFDDGSTSGELSFEETPTLQGISLDPAVETTSVAVVILSTTPPGDRDYTAISEIRVRGLP